MTRLTRRSMLAAAGAGLASTAGCLSLVTGDKPLTFSAEPATVPDSVLEETGYSFVEKRSPEISREFDVAGQTRTVTVTNHVTTYKKSIDLATLGSVQGGLFAAFTTPKIEIAGQAFNPISQMSTRDLLTRVADRYAGLSVGPSVGSEEIQTLGTTATVERYEAKATFKGQQIPIYLLLARIEHDEDYVVPVGGYPRQLSGEKENVYTLIEGLEH